jgi:hypothetical protein
MREIFKQAAKELDMPKTLIEEIWQSQFDFVFNQMKTDHGKLTAEPIKLPAFGTFSLNVPQLKIYQAAVAKKAANNPK